MLMQPNQGLYLISAMGFNIYTNILGVLVLFSSICLLSGSSMDSITSSKFIKDPETLSSSEFKLGFFSPENSTNRYLGIWYLSESAVIWVANRNQPVRDSSGLVTVSEDGNLVVLNGQKQTLWSSNVFNISLNSIAQLLDTGNLVLKDNTTGMIHWESFQHPSDSFVPKMKLSSNRRTDEKAKLTSWKSLSDPSIGSFSASLERLNAPEVFIWNGSRPYWRSGPWNRRVFLGLYWFRAYDSYLDGFNLRSEQDKISITFDLVNKSDFAVFKLDYMGQLFVTGWRDQKKVGVWISPNSYNECHVYGRCGEFGSCHMQSSPICTCLSGFEPRNLEEWNRQNWTSGCARKAPLMCEVLKNGGEADIQDDFLKLEMMKVPDFVESSHVQEEKCRTQCLENCSCVAYAYDDTIGCMSWSVNLIDIQKFPSGGVDLNIRLSNSEFVNNEKNENKRKGKAAGIAITVTIGTIIVAVCAFFFWTRAAKHAGKSHSKGQTESITGDIKQIKPKELPQLDFDQIVTATNNFHSSNKLGQGGFGPVYKGELQNGQQIAVKRLSRTSGQGLEEFTNEVLVISKLQHRNLVKLLGFCVQRDEKMLIYEYMPNKSLDAIIFDPQREIILDWRRRFNIIEGVARGLLYLHRDSRLKIIHRDLKAGNILLDEELNPKISDFGLAKIFAASEDEANTRRVVGTYGYMSPEYAMEGLVSEKSDVFSFGVLLLEIVSGRKNTSFYNNELSLSLLGFAWKLWNEENIIPLIDSEICVPEFHTDILRCIHTGLLCVQEFARDRPTMATITSMLNSEIADLPPPKEPAYTRRQAILSAKSPQTSNGMSSLNNITITEFQGR